MSSLWKQGHDVYIAALRKILEQYKCDITIETVRGVGYILQ